MIRAEALSVSLGGNEIVRDISLAVAHGEWLGLIGPNGAGKTTTLRALAALVPYSGDIELDGRSLNTLPRREIAKLVALVPQSPQTPPDLTVAEYVLLGRTPHIAYLSGEGRGDRVAAESAMARLGVREFARRSLRSLSGGELQRVVLARALAQDAPILLLDEPTSALDLGRQQLVLELVDELRHDNGLTVVAAMHDLSLAGQYADRLVLLDRGAVVGDGLAVDVLTEERLNEFYGASVHVIRDGGSVYVLPRRLGR
jgi:iron complex transport system ATP-binding protein